MLTLIGTLVVLGMSRKHAKEPLTAANTSSHVDLGPGQKTNQFQQPRSLAELVALPSEQLQQVDIGVMNLLCAEGLPGSENLDVDKESATLDEWAALVQRLTKEQHSLFERNPAEYEHSEKNFKMAMLVDVLQSLCGIRYNPDWLYISTNKNVPRQEGYAPYGDARNIFINGLIEQKMGTCANMATFYVAVARRCGYPVYLVRAKSHFFARWDDGKERFNCEGTNRGMVEPYRRTDEHYGKWPAPITDEEMRDGYYLKNMTPNAMLAEFLFMRGDAMWRHDIRTPAIGCFVESYRRAPQFNEYQRRVVESLKLVNKRLEDLSQSRPLNGSQNNPGNPLGGIDALHEVQDQVNQLERLKTQLAQLQPNQSKQ